LNILILLIFNSSSNSDRDTDQLGESSSRNLFVFSQLDGFKRLSSLLAYFRRKQQKLLTLVNSADRAAETGHLHHIPSTTNPTDTTTASGGDIGNNKASQSTHPSMPAQGVTISIRTSTSTNTSAATSSRMTLNDHSSVGAAAAATATAALAADFAAIQSKVKQAI
jgi:hypothetical protein